MVNIPPSIEPPFNHDRSLVLTSSPRSVSITQPALVAGGLDSLSLARPTSFNMVLISTKKYACETCIKGHRSSACKHTDRPLYEIKKKGRPITQCEHCRQLRKTKQVHVKCICGLKDDPPSSPHAPSGSKKGNNVMLGSAAFPHGLPEALEASVASQALSEGASSDSDHGGGQNSCSCNVGGDCQCCTPRKSAPRHRRRENADSSSSSRDQALHLPGTPGSDAADPPMQPSRTPAHILARIAELRPVLPRPASQEHSDGPLHDPSRGTTHSHHTNRHDHVMFSPYGRAYDLSHDYHRTHGTEQHNLNENRTPMPPMSGQNSQLAGSNPNWQPSITHNSLSPGSTAPSFPSMCGCGDGCQCPGCIDHSGTQSIPTLSAFVSCTNPGSCGTCLDCTIMSLPTALPPDTALSIYDAYQTQSIDEWLRQVSLPTSNTVLASASEESPSVDEFAQNTDFSWAAFDLPPSIPSNSQESQSFVRNTTARDGGFPGLEGTPIVVDTAPNDNSCCGSSSPQHESQQRLEMFGYIPTSNSIRESLAERQPLLVVPESNRARSSSIPQSMNRGHEGRSATSGVYESLARSGQRMRVGDDYRFQSTPNLFSRPNVHNATHSFPPLTTARSDSYAVSNPGSDGSVEDVHSSYNPSLNEMQLY